jgi:hypothetical protein
MGRRVPSPFLLYDGKSRKNTDIILLCFNKMSSQGIHKNALFQHRVKGTQISCFWKITRIYVTNFAFCAYAEDRDSKVNFRLCWNFAGGYVKSSFFIVKCSYSERWWMVILSVVKYRKQILDIFCGYLYGWYGQTIEKSCLNILWGCLEANWFRDDVVNWAWAIQEKFQQLGWEGYEHEFSHRKMLFYDPSSESFRDY